MRRWDRLQDAYMEEYRARGLSQQTVAHVEARLDRWGRWLKKRRPRVIIEHIDALTITRYLASCTSFRSKATPNRRSGVVILLPPPSAFAHFSDEIRARGFASSFERRNVVVRQRSPEGGSNLTVYINFLTW